LALERAKGTSHEKARNAHVRRGKYLLALAGSFYVYGQDKAVIPDGFDAMQAASKSHRVIFENALVRVLEVNCACSGRGIPMHHTGAEFLFELGCGSRTPPRSAIIGRRQH